VKALGDPRAFGKTCMDSFIVPFLQESVEGNDAFKSSMGKSQRYIEADALISICKRILDWRNIRLPRVLSELRSNYLLLRT
jgi:hypothetical protein